MPTCFKKCHYSTNTHTVQMTISPLPSRQLPYNALSGLLRTTLNPTSLPTWDIYSLHTGQTDLQRMPYPLCSTSTSLIWRTRTPMPGYWLILAQHQHLQLGPGLQREKAACRLQQKNIQHHHSEYWITTRMCFEPTTLYAADTWLCCQSQQQPHN